MLPSVGPNAGLKPGSAQFADPAGCQLTKHTWAFLRIEVSELFEPSIPSIGSTTGFIQEYNQ